MKNIDLNKTLLKVCLSVIFIFTILISCQSLKYGNVVDKWHEPANRQTKMMPMAVPNGKTMSVICIPYSIYDDEDWCIKVKGIGTKGDTLIKKYYISKEVFDTLEIGKFVCLNNSCDKDTNNTKTRLK